MTVPGTLGRPLLEVASVSKRYGGTLALSDVDLTVDNNDLHALVGGNGSGKSTLIRILSGVERADAGGEISIRQSASPLRFWSARDARSAGIRVVHQDVGIFPDLTVADNMAAGHGYPTGPALWVRKGRWHAHTAATLQRFGVDATPTTLVRQLRPATQTMVAVARALQDVDETESGLLILDEPTTALPLGEVEHLFAALRQCTAAGHAVLFVSHRLPEILALCGTVTVLRDGERVVTRPTAGMSERELGELVAGHPLADTVHRPMTRAAKSVPILKARGLAYGPLTGVDLDLRPGEVTGIAGLLGSGRSTLLRLLYGDLRPSGGTLHVDGCAQNSYAPPSAVRSGIAYVPENRARDALFASLSLDANLAATVIPSYWRTGFLRRRRQRRDSIKLVRSNGIKTGDVAVPPGALSGGNQQKVVLARWLRTKPKVLLLDNPTQGVDVGAREEIHVMLRDAARQGAAILISGDDYEELALVCDTVEVLRDGRLCAHINSSELSADRIGREVYGESR